MKKITDHESFGKKDVNIPPDDCLPCYNHFDEIKHYLNSCLCVHVQRSIQIHCIYDLTIKRLFSDPLYGLISSIFIYKKENS